MSAPSAKIFTVGDPVSSLMPSRPIRAVTRATHAGGGDHVGHADGPARARLCGDVPSAASSTRSVWQPAARPARRCRRRESPISQSGGEIADAELRRGLEDQSGRGLAAIAGASELGIAALGVVEAVAPHCDLDARRRRAGADHLGVHGRELRARRACPSRRPAGWRRPPAASRGLRRSWSASTAPSIRRTSSGRYGHSGRPLALIDDELVEDAVAIEEDGSAGAHRAGASPLCSELPRPGRPCQSAGGTRAGATRPPGTPRRAASGAPAGRRRRPRRRRRAVAV